MPHPHSDSPHFPFRSALDGRRSGGYGEQQEFGHLIWNAPQRETADKAHYPLLGIPA